jgi:hypothetical protein
VPKYHVNAEFIATGVPANALSTILTTCEDNGWDPDVNYHSGNGSTLRFKVSAVDFDALDQKLRAIYETIAQASIA